MKRALATLVRKLTKWAWINQLDALNSRGNHYEQTSYKLDHLLTQCLSRFETIRDISSKGSPQRAHAKHMVEALTSHRTQ